MLAINGEIRIPLDEIRFSFVRSSGPGGQNVNKVASKAVLRWNPAQSGLLSDAVLERLQKLYPRCLTGEGDMVLTSQRTRDALKNKNDCLNKLRVMLLRALKEPKRRIPTRPTRSAIRKRLEDKARNARKKRERRKKIDDEP